MIDKSTVFAMFAILLMAHDIPAAWRISLAYGFLGVSFILDFAK